jgi:hypothetical protein
MPKPMYVWSGSAWVSVATEVESLAGFATQSYADNVPGSKLIVPSSVAVGSGSGSVGTSGAVTFSGASSVSLNDVFNASYTNYFVQFNGQQSTSVGFTMRLRVSSADNTNSTYNNAGVTYFANNSTTTVGAENATSFNLSGGFTRTGNYTIQFFEPFNTQYTAYISDAVTSDGTTSVEARRNASSGFFEATTSFTGFTLIPASGTITGTIRVYGMKN